MLKLKAFSSQKLQKKNWKCKKLQKSLKIVTFSRKLKPENDEKTKIELQNCKTGTKNVKIAENTKIAKKFEF